MEWPLIKSWFKLTEMMAIAAFVVSVISLYFSWHNKRLMAQQEERRQPLLKLSVKRGYQKTAGGQGSRTYAFLISIANPTDTDNAISDAELVITYLRARVEHTLKLPANDCRAPSLT